ncbi:hypothetical protein CHUAL_002742 [Chamberlinius hualienensis]
MDFHLTTIDYVIVIGSLLLSSIIGLYYGAIKKKENTAAEYFLASRQLSLFQITCSTFSTIVSSGGIVGLSTEVYYFGFQSFIGSIFYPISYFISMKLFFPVFYKIGSPDIFTYYEKRFFKKTRILLSFLAITERGGVRGVSIADTIQGFVITASVIAVFVFGIVHIGGLSVIWNRNWNSGRLNIFKFDVNPTIRHTFWSATVGNFFESFSYESTNQMLIMRVMAAASIKKAQRAGLSGSCIAFVVYFSFACFGLILYAAYYSCDPVQSGSINNPNQLLSLFIGRELSVYTGLAGIFFAGFVCAALSTLSSSFNAVSALVMETFVKPRNILKNEFVYITVAKFVVVFQGLLALLGVLLIQLFPNLYQAMSAHTAVANGPQFALLCIGMFFPRANSKCAIAAFGFGILFMLWVVTGSLVLEPDFRTFPLSTEGCSNLTFATTEISMSSVTYSSWVSWFPISSVSFTWFTTIAVTSTFTTFVFLSVLFGADKVQAANMDLIPEPIQKFQKKLSRRWQKVFLCDIYQVNQEQEMITIQNNQMISS